jgi:peptidyl-prolyl cis-trans isomerase C
MSRLKNKRLTDPPKIGIIMFLENFNPNIFKDTIMKTHFTILISLMLFLTACGLALAADQNTPDVNAVMQTDQPDNSAVALSVNARDITEAQIDKLVQPELDRMSEQAKRLPPSILDQLKERLRKQAIDTKITEYLLDEAVKEQNIVVTDEELNAYFKELLTQQKMSMDDFKALVAAYGQSFEEIRRWNRKSLGYKKIMGKKWQGKVDVNEADAQKFYNENPEKFTTPLQVRASHVLISPDTSDPNLDPNQAKAIAKSKIDDLLQKVKDGNDFAELAKQYSSCPSKEQGGDLNFFGKGQMVPEFESVAFELQPGQVSDVVETQFGYHIIKVTDRKEEKITSFEEAKENLINYFKRQKEDAIAQAYIEELKAQAAIVYPAGKEPKPEPMPPSLRNQ